MSVLTPWNSPGSSALLHLLLLLPLPSAVKCPETPNRSLCLSFFIRGRFLPSSHFFLHLFRTLQLQFFWNEPKRCRTQKWDVLNSFSAEENIKVFCVCILQRTGNPFPCLVCTISEAALGFDSSRDFYGLLFNLNQCGMNYVTGEK